MAESLPIFVYGTLKLGEERSCRWPYPPQSVEPAVTRAELYDLGPYPAILPGDDPVAGELWTLDPEHLDHTLRVLDEIECFGVDDVDLYVRRVIPCRTQEGREQFAYAYFLADSRAVANARRVRPDSSGVCCWTGRR